MRRPSEMRRARPSANKGPRPPGIECSPSIALSRGFVPQTWTAKYLLPRPTGACRSLCLSKVGKHIISETIGDPGGYVVHVPIRPGCFKITTGKKVGVNDRAEDVPCHLPCPSGRRSRGDVSSRIRVRRTQGCIEGRIDGIVPALAPEHRRF